jgi:tetratricopeptide (TPR) repeat protein
MGRQEEAVAGFDRALALQPGWVEAWVNRGNALLDLARAVEAVASYDRALALQPDLAQAHSNRADALRLLERFDEALAACDRAIALAPDTAQPRVNRGAVLVDLARFEQARAAYEAALALEPDNPEYLLSSSFAVLGVGDYAEGFRRYHYRWAVQGPRRFVPERAFAAPLWLGETPIAGKTLLLHSEQGFGDTLQFCRYADLAAGLGARVVIEAPKPLAALLRSLKGAAEVVAQGDALPPFDAHCPMMSLPLALGTRVETIPGDTPYLYADPAKAQDWARRLGPRTRPRVGLVWSSGFRANQPQLWPINRRKTLPLAKLAALQGLALEFHSLQKGEPAESEFATLMAKGWGGPPIASHADALQDFSDTAALMQNLDLVVSVDTSTAHLAGALGRPVWVLNPFGTCWRWFTGREDSPWYPTARLFRQAAYGDWDAPVQALRAALESFAEGAAAQA